MAPKATQEPASESAPLVTIGIPVYNGADHLAEAIESVLAQDYPNLELVICDNASEDETETICRHYAAVDPRVRYLRNTTNIGFMPNFRRVRDEARGKYFSWTADDDVLHDPSYASTLVAHLEQYPDVVACTTHYRLINSELAFVGPVITLEELEPHRWPAGLRAFFRLPNDWKDTMVYGMVRREDLQKVPLPQRTFKGRPHIFWWEVDLLTTLSRFGRVVALPLYLWSYRLGVRSVGTGLSQSVSIFDLYRMGLRVKLRLIGRALRMPVSVHQRILLLGTAFANLFRANLGQPYNHDFVARRRELALTQMDRVVDERANLIDVLWTAILERRQVAADLGLDVGPLPEAPEIEDVPAPADSMIQPGPVGESAQLSLLAFFRPPAEWQVRRAHDVHERLGVLVTYSDKQLRVIERLNDEAARLLGLIEEGEGAVDSRST